MRYRIYMFLPFLKERALCRHRKTAPAVNPVGAVPTLHERRLESLRRNTATHAKKLTARCLAVERAASDLKDNCEKQLWRI